MVATLVMQGQGKMQALVMHTDIRLCLKWRAGSSELCAMDDMPHPGNSSTGCLCCSGKGWEGYCGSRQTG